jgi:Tfp pilus assembly protein PilN
MRPIDLTPSEMRQGARAPMRTGPVPYILLGSLVAVLLGVALLVTTGNQVSEKETEVAQLKRENAAAKQEARRLAPYVQFQSLHEQRLSTIASLANSRFDWERVIRELSLVLPADVWLTELSAAASGQGESGGGSGLSGGIAGPAMELEGCTVGQESVARFVTALKDIDGVTRVAVASSELPSKGEGEASSGGGEESGGGSECRTRENIAKFKIVVAFDAAPVPVTAEGEGEAPATAAGAAETTSTEAESGETESTEGEEG